MPNNKRKQDVKRKGVSTKVVPRNISNANSRSMPASQGQRHETIEQIKRRHAKKQRLKKRKRKIAMTIVTTIFLAVALCCVAFLTPFFLIDHVSVDGYKKTSENEIKTAAAIDLGQNIFSINLPQIERRIEKIPYIQKADIKRKLPKGIQIHVTERQIYCYVKDSRGYYAIDRDAVLLDQPKTLDAHYLCVEGIGIKSAKIGDKLNFSNLQQFNEFITLIDVAKSEKVMNHITNISVSDIDNITFLYDNKFKVNFGDDEEADRKFQYLISVSKSEQRKGSIQFDMDAGKTYFSAD